MGTCPKSDNVEAYVAESLSAHDKACFEEHLTSCPQCRQAVDDCRRDSDLAKGIQLAFEDTAWCAPPRSTLQGTGQEPPIIDKIDGYEVLHEIHRGGQGVVYKAIQIATKRAVALKVLLQGPYASAKQRHRFEREIDLVASMRHPNIVTLYDSSTTGGRHYFAMEYIHGQTLDRYVSHGRLSLEAKLRLFGKICSAVTFAHQRGVIHRDLKPANILVDSDGEPHILDFGLAKSAGPDLQGGTPVTVSGEFMGTLAYASPEQTKGDPRLIDIRTDVYSLGVILFEMLTGGYPYEVVGRMADVLNNIVETAPKKPSTVSRGINDEVETIVLKALAKEKDRRYQSAETLARDVGHYLAGEPLDAKRDSTWYVIRKSLRRHRVAVGVAVAFVLLLSVSTVALSVMYRNQSVAREEADEARDIADMRYQEIIRLADVKRLANAEAAADQLWPAHPENIEAMETWLAEQGIPLKENLPIHESALAQLRARALDYDAQQQQADRLSHPLAGALAERTEQLPQLEAQLAEVMAASQADGVGAADSGTADTEGTGDDEAQAVELQQAIATTKQRIAELQEAVKERRTWRFRDDQTQWWHDTLAGLVEDLEAFVDPDPTVGTLAGVEKRLAFAQGILHRSVTGPEAAARWSQATADIAQLDVYGGLRLKPQLGLLPLRRDPQSGLWEFWHIQTGVCPEPRAATDEAAPSAWAVDGDTGLVFVLVPGGTFWMGAQKDDPEGPNYDPLAGGDEGPVHQVTIDPFFISKYEMTQGQWMRFTSENPSRYGVDFVWMGTPAGKTPAHENCPWNPVEEVSWVDCQVVLSRLELDFPTEAQWEYAARGGTQTPWWTGADVESVGATKAGNLADGWTKRKGGPNTWVYNDWLEDRWVVHAPVGSFAPNGFGLHDTIGNLWEWCRDPLGTYENEVAPGDGYRVPTDRSRRVHRGGGYSNIADLARSAYRNHLAPDLRYHYLGVRPVSAIAE